MYQSIYYDFSTYTYHLRDDKQGWLEFQYRPTYWKRVNEYQEGARPVLTGGWAIPTKKLDKNDVVIGPATDGGYYLIGLKKLHLKIFDNKNWGTSTVREDTLKNLEKVDLESA